MSFLAKVEAIHPRGERKKSGIKKSPGGFSRDKGKNLKENLDWISSSINYLMDDYVFKPSTNKIFRDVRALHDFVVDQLPTEFKVSSYARLLDLVEKFGAEISRLHGKKLLPEGVTDKMVAELEEVVAKVLQQKEKLQELLSSYKTLQKGFGSLGFNI